MQHYCMILLSPKQYVSIDLMSLLYCTCTSLHIKCNTKRKKNVNKEFIFHLNYTSTRNAYLRSNFFQVAFFLNQVIFTGSKH